MCQSLPPPTRSHRSAHGRRGSSAREQHQPSRRSPLNTPRPPAPVARPAARGAAERGEDEALARGDFAAGGEELPQPFLPFEGEGGATPLDILLKRTQAA